jgi:hypothetical protein
MNLSMSWLFSSFVVSTIGFGFFMYGKKEARVPALTAGLALMVFPGFIGSVAWMICITGLVLGALWGATRYGL